MLQMRAAAELKAVAACLDHANDVAVLLAKEHHGAHLLGFGDRLLHRLHRKIIEDLLVDNRLDFSNLLARHPAVMREVESQTIRRHQRPTLVHMVAENRLQRLVEQMRRRMVAADGDAARAVNPDVDRRPAVTIEPLVTVPTWKKKPDSFWVSSTSNAPSVLEVHPARVPNLTARVRHRTASGRGQSEPSHPAGRC